MLNNIQSFTYPITTSITLNNIKYIVTFTGGLKPIDINILQEIFDNMTNSTMMYFIGKELINHHDLCGTK